MAAKAAGGETFCRTELACTRAFVLFRYVSTLSEALEAKLLEPHGRVAPGGQRLQGKFLASWPLF